MKTPDEIKKGLELCTTIGSHCDDCPYDGQCLTDRQPEVDALAYIQQLESRLAQVERERDAAVADLTVSAECDFCKYKDLFPACGEKSCYSCDKECPCALYCKAGNGFKWRGVCAENTKEE